MKITTLKDVNARLGSPDTQAPVARTRSVGETLQLKSVLIGKQVNESAIWYLCDDGFYYWSGAFLEREFALDALGLNAFDSAAQDSILRELITAVIDTMKDKVTGYNGCGIGHKDDNAKNPVALKIYVDRKLDKHKTTYQVLKAIAFKGITVPTDVIETGTVALQSYQQPNPSKRDLESTPILLPGGRLQNRNGKTWGTRSIFVEKIPSGSRYLIGSYHVALAHVLPQLTKYDGERGDTATFQIRKAIPNRIAAGRFGGSFDFAAIEVPIGVQVGNYMNNVLVRDFVRLGDLHGLKERKVCMIGCASGSVCGHVIDVLPEGFLRAAGNPPHLVPFKNVVVCERLAVDGDSGGPVIDAESELLIGFILGGKTDKTGRQVSYVIPFHELYYTYGYKLL